MARSWRIAAAVVGTLGLALSGGCGARRSEPQYLYGVPNVEAIEVTIGGGSTVRVNAVVRGTVRDLCTRINSVRQSLDGSDFSLTLTTRRALADVCADVETPFEATIPLVVRGLEPGSYTVTAGDVSTPFEYERGGMAPQL